MQKATIHFIGILESEITKLADAPKIYTESDKRGTLEIYPRYQAGIEGIKAGQTIIVLFWLHQADREILKVYPRGDVSRGLHGVFATRSPMRPNPIAISELEVLAVRDNRIDVSGLDILDGTPIVDIKKKI